MDLITNRRSSWKNLQRLDIRTYLFGKKSLEIANTIIEITENLDTDKKHFRLIDQIEAASMSVPMMGWGKRSLLH